MIKSALQLLIIACISLAANAALYTTKPYVDTNDYKVAVASTNYVNSVSAGKQDVLPYPTNNIPRTVLDLADWVKSNTPPESVPQNITVLTDGKLETKTGTRVGVSAIDGALPEGATNGFVIGMSAAWTNLVSSVVTNDVNSTSVGSSFATPTIYSYTSESINYAITNLAVRWNGQYWEMHVAGWADNQTYHDGWYKCATTNWNDGNPYCTVNSNLNTDAVTVWIGNKTETGFSQNIGDGLRTYKNGTAIYTNGTRNSLGLAYARDLPALTNGLATAASVTAATNAIVGQIDFTTNNVALVESITNTATKTYIQNALEVYLYKGTDGGIYVHSN